MFWIFNFLILMQFFDLGDPVIPSDFTWKNRLIIIFGECDSSEWFADGLKKDLSDRKLLVLHFNEGYLVESNFHGKLKTADFLKLSPKNSEQLAAWILVGLDGGIKNSGVSVPESREIFRIIDAMPMRQSELVKKGNQDNSTD